MKDRVTHEQIHWRGLLEEGRGAVGTGAISNYTRGICVLLLSYMLLDGSQNLSLVGVVRTGYKYESS